MLRPRRFSTSSGKKSVSHSVSDLARGNSDRGPRKTRTKTQTTPDSVFTRERRNLDHGLGFWGGKTQTMVWVFPVFGVGSKSEFSGSQIRWNKGGGEKGRSGGRANRAWRGKREEKWGKKGGRKGARKHTRKTLILVPLWFRYSWVAC